MFIVGETYNRRDAIHKIYGGQQQGGIATPANHSFVLIFTGETGETHGYADSFQPDGTFWYTGEGQVGDMEMVRGNLAIKDHQQNGKSLLLFEYVKRGYVRFIGNAVCIGYHIESRPDTNRNHRNAIVFHLALITPDDEHATAKEPQIYPIISGKSIDKAIEKKLKPKSLAELRNIALRLRLRANLHHLHLHLVALLADGDFAHRVIALLPEKTAPAQASLELLRVGGHQANQLAVLLEFYGNHGVFSFGSIVPDCSGSAFCTFDSCRPGVWTIDQGWPFSCMFLSASSRLHR
jgi:hypothetical protein